MKGGIILFSLVVGWGFKDRENCGLKIWDVEFVLKWKTALKLSGFIFIGRSEMLASSRENSKISNFEEKERLLLLIFL